MNFGGEITKRTKSILEREVEQKKLGVKMIFYVLMRNVAVFIQRKKLQN